MEQNAEFLRNDSSFPIRVPFPFGLIIEVKDY